MIKFWQKYKDYRKLQKARYLQFKCNSIFWTKIDIETIWREGDKGDIEDYSHKDAIGFGSLDFNYESIDIFYPIIIINYKLEGIYRKVVFKFYDEEYDNSAEAKINAKIKLEGLLIDINNYLQLKKDFNKNYGKIQKTK